MKGRDVLDVLDDPGKLIRDCVPAYVVVIIHDIAECTSMVSFISM